MGRAAVRPAVVVREHVGGMSPACATTVATTRAGLVFVKAVGRDLNRETVVLFRQEAELLPRLPSATCRPRLLATTLCHFDVRDDNLLAFGGSSAWKARQPGSSSLPTLAAFCREDADRMLSIARLRLA